MYLLYSDIMCILFIFASVVAFFIREKYSDRQLRVRGF